MVNRVISFRRKHETNIREDSYCLHGYNRSGFDGHAVIRDWSIDMKTIMEDGREIVSLNVGQETTYAGLGKITPYHENGEMAAVVWFAVYDKDNQLIRRINGSHVESIKYDWSVKP